MGRHKCEVIACLSSQMQCKFMNCYIVHCTYGKLIWFDLIWFDSGHETRQANFRTVPAKLRRLSAIDPCDLYPFVIIEPCHYWDHDWTSMTVLLTVGSKCTLAALYDVPGEWRCVCRRDSQTDRQTDGRQNVTLLFPLDAVSVISSYTTGLILLLLIRLDLRYYFVRPTNDQYDHNSLRGSIWLHIFHISDFILHHL